MAQPMTGIDPADLETCIRVLAAGRRARRGPPRFGGRAAGQRQDVQGGEAAPPARGRGTRSPRPTAPSSRPPPPARRTASTTRPQGIPLVVQRGRRDRRARCIRPRALLHLQAALHRGRRVLPPALPGLRRRCNHAKRDARTDLTGRRALLTGGRAKIGMYIALRLLRDGAHTTITTRFPNDAVRRFTRDAGQRRLAAPAARSSASTCATRPRWSRWPTRWPRQGPLDILINNAAQTVRRSPGAYAPLVDGRVRAAARGPTARSCSPSATPATRTRSRWPARCRDRAAAADRSRRRVTELALVAGSASPERIAAGTAIDAGGLRARPRTRSTAGSQTVDEVDPLELLEVQLCNTTAPFILVSRLRPAMAASAGAPQVRRQRLGDGGRSSAAATRARATRTPTWPRPR